MDIGNSKLDFLLYGMFDRSFFFLAVLAGSTILQEMGKVMVST